MSSAISWETRYRQLRKKYEALCGETFTLSEDLYRANALNTRLKLEKKHLLYTIESMGTSGKRGMKAPKARKSPGEAAKALQAAMTQLEAERHPKDLDTSVMSHNMDPMDDSDGEGKAAGGAETNKAVGAASVAKDDIDLCVAILGPGRSCKTKKSAGSQYCWRHAPLDPNSSSTYCRFTDSDTHKKCSNVVPKTKKPLLCNSHLQKVSMYLSDASVMNGATEADIAAALAHAPSKGADSSEPNDNSDTSKGIVV